MWAQGSNFENPRIKQPITLSCDTPPPPLDVGVKRNTHSSQREVTNLTCHFGLQPSVNFPLQAGRASGKLNVIFVLVHANTLLAIG